MLVNNAATAQMGYFEEISPEAFERQLTTNLLGPLNVTRAVLPVMRQQRSGHVITVFSTAGLTGMEFTSAYATSKFGLGRGLDGVRAAPLGGWAHLRQGGRHNRFRWARSLDQRPRATGFRGAGCASTCGAGGSGQVQHPVVDLRLLPRRRVLPEHRDLRPRRLLRQVRGHIPAQA